MSPVFKYETVDFNLLLVNLRDTRFDWFGVFFPFFFSFFSFKAVH